MQKKIAISICCLLLSLLALDAAYAAKAALPRTGQTLCYDPSGSSTIACAGTGQDGDKLKGAASPAPRFTDNGDGTVKDNLTGLIWLKNANCSANLGGVDNTGNGLTWADALTWSNNLASGSCSLSDGSTAGQWRLPSINELESLIDLSQYYPALPTGNPFSSTVQSKFYWSGSTYSGGATYAWFVGMDDGFVDYYHKPFNHYFYVWPVRAGQ